MTNEKRSQEPESTNEMSNDEEASVETSGPDDGVAVTINVARADSHDRDAAWGRKTSKHGKEESFFGYQEHTAVQVPDGNQEPDAEPRLIRRFELTPANDDVVDVSLSLLDRLNRPAKVLIVDRLYQFMAVERWKDKLTERGIHQVFDLRADQQGFTELNHTRWAAGHPHCPATPDELGTIPRPPGNASKKDREKFLRLITRRQQYAFRRVTTPTADGTARWECPAAAGSIGCPLRAGTVEAHLELGGEIVQDSPDPNSPDFPTCCSQRTVTLNPGPLRKLLQEHYWGSEMWQFEYNKRTYVEGSYGNRKNRSTEDLTRGHLRITGIALVMIASAMPAASCNLRMLRNWHERTGLGDPNHPLLKPDDDRRHWVYLSDDEAHRLAADYDDTGEDELGHGPR